MSQIIRNISSLREEWKQLVKKRIIKNKRRNQYTVPYQFNNTQNKNIRKADLLLIVKNIPYTIPNKNVFKLKTNIQFSMSINNEYSLGSLSIDPHSNNYKVVRIDKRKNLTILTLDEIHRPITPSDVLYQIFKTRNEQLAEAFHLYEQRNLEPSKFKINQISEMIEFESTIKGSPYACYVQIYENGMWRTFQKIFNQKMLQVLAISEEMLINYCNETKLIPLSAYMDASDEQLKVFQKIFSGRAGQLESKRDYINYNGDRFTATLKIKSFFIKDENKDQLFEYTYCVTDCENKWISEDRAKRNQREYFNIKPSNSTTDESSYIECQKRCGFKQMI
ncbi:unnamed protein product (macronuclear) [Paramecium tetraurelia]|uniref:Uncharacterized protein n=1 Tax=Paramecium tetraurelia TaxID=5888 RepID=A0D7E7_PARTE|nr:uncharacterized protein GSPATT00002006001 [Paramecium tetraurelia]CAK78964.1 unnamed protein product [Paramecium tetraurelia]|eukprot:XP_001446361.1 hypothetical protein (macronuclear) [Paramecium tetraurelia strain d4-2]